MKGTRKKITTYDQWESQLDAEVEAIWRRRNPQPHTDVFRQLDVLLRANSPWVPVILQTVKYAYNCAMEEAAAAAAAEEEDWPD
jgi:hypothetical protein